MILDKANYHVNYSSKAACITLTAALLLRLSAIAGNEHGSSKAAIPSDPAGFITALKKQGGVFAAIRALDSLRISGCVDEKFLGEYARYVFYSLVPLERDAFPVLVKAADEARPADTADACRFSWRIVDSKRAALPFFEYRAGFAFRKQFRLVFFSPQIRPEREAFLQVRDEPSVVSLDLTHRFFNRTDSAWCSIHIDVNDTKISPYEYLVARISGIYDSIEEKKDLPEFRALSLRCYNFGRFGDSEGTYTAYIVFDRSVIDPSKRKRPAYSANKNVRCTVTMRCGRAVADQAEARLQSILHAF